MADNPMKEADEAVAVYRDDYNCAQAVCSVYGARFGLDDSLAKRIACGFGAGMGRSADVCGAVSGAIMVLGLGYGMADAARQEEKELAYEKVRSFLALFEERYRSLRCADLLGCDISTPEGLREAREKDLMTIVCERVVADAGRILEGLLPP